MSNQAKASRDAAMCDREASRSIADDDKDAVSQGGGTSLHPMRELLGNRDAPALDEVFALIWLCGIR